MNSAATVAFGFPTSFCLQRKKPSTTPHHKVKDIHKNNAPEEELPVKIADVYSIHINNVYIFESHQSQVGKNLASEASCANDEDFTLFPQELFNLSKTKLLDRGAAAAVMHKCADSSVLRLQP